MEAPNNSTRRLRVAIAGGGLAGATLINVLQKYPHLDVQIYESAPEFSERGAAVGISSNAQNALSEMSPNLIELLIDAGALRMNSTQLVIVSQDNLRLFNSEGWETDNLWI